MEKGALDMDIGLNVCKFGLIEPQKGRNIHSLFLHGDAAYYLLA